MRSDPAAQRPACETGRTGALDVSHDLRQPDGRGLFLEIAFGGQLCRQTGSATYIKIVCLFAYANTLQHSVIDTAIQWLRYVCLITGASAPKSAIHFRSSLFRDDCHRRF